MLRKKLATFILLFSLVFSTSYHPLFAPRAQALLGVGDFGFDVEDVVKFVLDAIAIDIAQKMVDDMVKTTVTWANTGFEGGPAYVTEPKAYFTNVADGVAGEFIMGTDLGFLCSPFQDSIRISLQHQYYSPPQRQFQCTISGIEGNLEDFFGDFTKGGWDAWFSITQNPTNNPYGAFLTAKLELDNRIANELGLAEFEQDINQGFLSVKNCLDFNPTQEVIDDFVRGDWGPGSPGEAIANGSVEWDPSKPAEACIKPGPITSAGSTIKTQLDKVLPSGLDRLISAQHLEQLVGAFASGLLNRYVFSDKGLFSSDAPNSGNRELYDADKDNIYDGYDMDGDEELDVCHHGIIDAKEPASNTNCRLSSGSLNSPHFVPVCEKVARTTKDLEKYLDFVERNSFRKEYSNTWTNRTTAVSGSVDDLINTISRYETQRLDPALFALGEYSKLMDKYIESLAKNEDLKGRLDSDEDNRQKIIKNTRDTLNFLRNFSNNIGACNNPNMDALANVVPPEVDDPITEEGDTGSTQPPTSNATLSCSASPTTAVVNTTSVVWSVSSSLPSNSTTYEWQLGLGATTPNTSGTSAVTTYSTTGTKLGSVTALDSNGQQIMFASCSNQVTVSSDGEL